MNEVIINYNKVLLKCLSKMPLEAELIERLNVENTINCYSYNGAKFDNHFIISYLKDLYSEQWIDHIKITGTMTDMKIMKIDDFMFYDIKLMTGGNSLADFCKDLNIDVEKGKKKIDMAKMKTFLLAQ